MDEILETVPKKFIRSTHTQAYTLLAALPDGKSYRKASHSRVMDVNKHVLGVYCRRKMLTLKRKPSGYKVGGVSAYFFAPRFILYYLSLFNI